MFAPTFTLRGPCDAFVNCRKNFAEHVILGALMEPASRHQCLVYGGPPSRHLPALAEATRQRLGENYRCLYLNSAPMVAGMRSYLAAAGIDVELELRKGSLVLSSEQSHLVEGIFDPDSMIHMLELSLQLRCSCMDLPGVQLAHLVV